MLGRVGMLRGVPRYLARARPLSTKMLPALNVTLVGTASTLGAPFLTHIDEGLFGEDQPVKLRTIDSVGIKSAMDSVKESQVIKYVGATPTSDLKAGFKGSEIIVATSLSYELEKEAEKFATLGKAISQSAAKDVQVFVVGPHAHTLAMVVSGNLGRNFDVDQVVAVPSPEFCFAYDAYEDFIAEYKEAVEMVKSGKTVPDIVPHKLPDLPKIEKMIEDGVKSGDLDSRQAELAREGVARARDVLKNGPPNLDVHDEVEVEVGLSRLITWGGNDRNVVADCTSATYGLSALWTLDLVEDPNEHVKSFAEVVAENCTDMYNIDADASNAELVTEGAGIAIGAYFGGMAREWDSLGVMSSGDYGINPGLWYSVPVELSNRSLRRALNIPISPIIAEKMEASNKALASERDRVLKYIGEDPANRVQLAPAASYQEMTEKVGGM